MSDGDPIALMIARCAANRPGYATGNRPKNKDGGRVTNAVLRELFRTVAYLATPQEYVNPTASSFVFPGYISMSAGGNKLIHVPFHLIDAFPAGDELDEILAVADYVRYTSRGLLCISGSSMFLGG